MAVIGGRQVGNNELAVMGAGVLVFIFSFFPFFGVDLGPFGGKVTANAWHTGFLSWFPVLLAVVAAIVVAVRVFSTTTLPTLQVGYSFITLALAGLAALLLLIKLAIGYHGTDRQVGLFLALIAAIVQAAFAFLAFRVSGEAIPGQQRRAI